MARRADIKRKTNETDVSIKIEIDGSGKAEVDSGIGFFDHMLQLFAKHGFFDLSISVAGDLFVDGHHTVEDVGIVMGQALKQALGEKRSIIRYGTSFVPMDEALAMVSLDLSGRSYLVFEADFPSKIVGEMETELVEEFFRSLAFNAGITLHVKCHYGTNCHHMIEAMFKAFARALDEASKVDTSIEGVMSTKGTLN
jgi:imidazoleglycerol-phosphate dehydratase